MKVAVIGIGYVGIVTSLSFAKWGHDVIGVDVDLAKLNLLAQGVLPLYEPGADKLLQEMLQTGNLNFTPDLTHALEQSEVVYIAVGTPSAEDGSADLRVIQAVCHQIGSRINSYKAIVTKSTVPVGTGDRIKQWISSAMQEHNRNVPFDVASNPEFLREGTALQDALHPERIVIGADSPQAHALIASLYASLSAPILRTSLRDAEMIKYASNAFLATKISFVNEIAKLCETLGANVLRVAQGMGLDARIGPHFLQAGIGYGGSCFPKDVKALLHAAKQNGMELKILQSVTEVNDTQAIWFLDKIDATLGDLAGKHVALLGLTFKPETDDIRESPALRIIEHLLEKGAQLSAFDPKGMEAVQKLFPEVRYTDDAYQAVEGADALLLLTEWREIVDLDWAKARKLTKGAHVFDGRNALHPEAMRQAGFAYHGVGRCSE